MNYLETFKKTDALLEGHFLLSSGLHSSQYFQCAKVLQYPESMTLLCKPIAEHFAKEKIDAVISPALGGIVVGTEVGRQLNVKTIFAERSEGTMTIRRGFEVKENERYVVIEDVVTTGGSVREVMNLIVAAKGKVVGVGFIVDRSNGKVVLSENQFSVMKMEVVTYSPDTCPLCIQNIPFVKPGSRIKKI